VVIHCTRMKRQFLTTSTMMTETKQVPEIFNSDPATKWMTAHTQFIQSMPHESLEYCANSLLNPRQAWSVTYQLQLELLF
jgi:hypothetical protein